MSLLIKRKRRRTLMWKKIRLQIKRKRRRT